MVRCETCGAELQDASQRFCGGDRCHRVFMKRPRQGTPGLRPASPRASTRAPSTDISQGRLMKAYRTDASPEGGAAESHEEVGG